MLQSSMPKEISVVRGRIEIKFPYSEGLVLRVKELPDRSWDKNQKVWHIPATSFHARQVVTWAATHKFSTSPDISRLAQDKAQAKKDKVQRPGLYPFQNKGVDFLLYHGRAILADDMGLGKTVQALYFMKEIRATKILVVCPASVSYNWQAEVSKWMGWDSNVVTKIGQSLPHGHLTIMSYAIMTKRYAELFKQDYDCILADEMHALGNSKSQRSRAFKFLSGSKYMLGLSGTPFLNRPKELFPFLNMLEPDDWPNFWRYGKRYCNGHKSYFGWDFNGHSNELELSDHLSDIMIRRTKAEVLDELPPLTRVEVPVDIDIRNFNSHWSLLCKNLYGSRAEAIVSINKGRHLAELYKVDAAIELAESILEQGNKVVMYCEFLDTLDLLHSRLERWGISIIQGSVSSMERNQLCQSFQNKSDTQVMLITRAGGEGINLYSSAYIIFVGRAWNPGREEQAEGRVHRIGQTKGVTAYYVIAKGTLDEDINALINEKRKVSADVYGLDDINMDIQDDLISRLRGRKK
jgi:SWI/SNF-related matrix-associated actin-dependent regulator 1 of chromatin subfamily A